MAGEVPSRFGPSALVVELSRLSAGVAAGRQEIRTNEEVLSELRKRFQLTEEQQAGVADLLNESANVPPLANLVNDVAAKKGAARFIVAVTADPTNGNLVGHELRREFIAPMDEAMAAEATDLTIAHCDADCRNWGWGPA